MSSEEDKSVVPYTEGNNGEQENEKKEKDLEIEKNEGEEEVRPPPPPTPKKVILKNRKKKKTRQAEGHSQTTSSQPIHYIQTIEPRDNEIKKEKQIPLFTMLMFGFAAISVIYFFWMAPNALYQGESNVALRHLRVKGEFELLRVKDGYNLPPVLNVTREEIIENRIGSYSILHLQDILESYARSAKLAHICLHHLVMESQAPRKICVIGYNNGTDFFTVINPEITGGTMSDDHIIKLKESSTLCPNNFVIRRRKERIWLRWWTVSGVEMINEFRGAPAFSAQIIVEEFRGETICELPLPKK